MSDNVFTISTDNSSNIRSADYHKKHQLQYKKNMEVDQQNKKRKPEEAPDAGHHEEGTVKITAVDNIGKITKPHVVSSETINIHLHQEMTSSVLISYADERRYNFRGTGGNRDLSYRSGPLSRTYLTHVISNPFNLDNVKISNDPSWMGNFTFAQTASGSEDVDTFWLSRPWVNYWKQHYNHYHIMEGFYKFHIKPLGTRDFTRGYSIQTVVENNENVEKEVIDPWPLSVTSKIHTGETSPPKTSDLKLDQRYEYYAFVVGRTTTNPSTTIATYNKDAVSQSSVNDDFGSGLSWDDIHENGWIIHSMEKITIHPENKNDIIISGKWKPGRFKRDVEEDDKINPWRLTSEGNEIEEQIRLCIIPTNQCTHHMQNTFTTNAQVFMQKNFFQVSYEIDYKLQLKNNKLQPTNAANNLNHNITNGSTTFKTPGFYGDYAVQTDVSKDSSGLHGNGGMNVT